MLMVIEGTSSIGVIDMLIDGVFSGGGIKGLALIGAYEEIEKRGFTFARVAGTSAGSIIAAFIAAGYTSKEIYTLFDELDVVSLLDQQRSKSSFPFIKWILLYLRMGLYKGAKLEKWLEEKLANKGLRTFADIPPQTLRIIASDLTNGQLLVLPDDLQRYGISPHTFSIAKAIRMSCSIPYFFEPVKLKTQTGVSVVVDGGVLSNFPIWLFEQENGKKTRPVLGLKLAQNIHGVPKNKVNNAFQLFEALFETMKDAHDARYISRKVEKDIIFIQTPGVATTEFKLSEEKKRALYEMGKKSASSFLRNWSY
jgi:NTE family protein